MDPMESLSRLLLTAGVFLFALGGFVWLIRRVGFLGRLPGDIVIERPNFTFHFPLGTSLFLSLVLTLLLNLLLRR